MKFWLLAAGRCVCALPVLVMIAGCVGNPAKGSWGAGYGHSTVLQAAKAAVRQPSTWVPLATAALLTVDDWDDEVSEWGARERPLFGSDASDVSDTLRDITTGTYVLSAALAPSDNWRDKVGGLGVGISTMLVEGGLSESFKSLSRRDRPNGRGSRSFPSGHASQSASRAALTRRNLQHFALRTWQRQGLNVGLHSLALGTAWARVEAQKHHATDVFVGMALGNFVANFMHNLLMRQGPQPTDVNVSFAPMAVPYSERQEQGYRLGGSITLTLALP